MSSSSSQPENTGNISTSAPPCKPAGTTRSSNPDPQQYSNSERYDSNSSLLCNEEDLTPRYAALISTIPEQFLQGIVMKRESRGNNVETPTTDGITAEVVLEAATCYIETLEKEVAKLRDESALLGRSDLWKMH